MVTQETLKKIQNEIISCGRDTRYKLEAYGFVLRGLNFYHTKSGERRHFSGQELSKGIVEFARKQYGPLTFNVLQNWGIHTTDDIGHIVYNLIDIQLIRKQESDRLDDFFNVFNIKEFLDKKDDYHIDKTHIKSIKGA